MILARPIYKEKPFCGETVYKYYPRKYIEMNTVLKPALTLFLGMPLLCPACSKPTATPAVVFVDGSDAFPADVRDLSVNPLILVVEINSDGKLSLNRIETGTIDDTTILSEKLRVIFEDREKALVEERGVFVEMNGVVKHEDFEKLVEALRHAEAATIRVIKK